MSSHDDMLPNIFAAMCTPHGVVGCQICPRPIALPSTAVEPDGESLKAIYEALRRLSVPNVNYPPEANEAHAILEAVLPKTHGQEGCGFQEPKP